MAGLGRDNPRVTVIIIFFNEAKYLEEAVQSVLAQTFDGWELLLCDDGSSDASTGIAKRYAERDPRIHYLEHDSHANKGMSATRNLGLAHAKGKEIAFLDGDDVWMHEKLEVQTRLLDENPQAAMTFGPLLEWHSWAKRGGGDWLYCVAEDGKHPFADSLVSNPQMLICFLNNENYIPSGVLFRHDAYKQVGGFENQFPGSYEDAVFHVKMCANFPVYVHAKPYYKYRIHPESCERQADPSAMRDKELSYLKWTRAYLDEQGLDDPSLNKAWDQAYQYCLSGEHYRRPGRLKSLANSTEQALIRLGRRVLPKAARDRLWAARNRVRG